MTDRIGQQLGNYRLARLLGQGGSAEVYLGEHFYLKSQAAIKVLSQTLSDTEKSDFLLEAQRLADLIHPHIIRVLDFAVEDDVPFLVMEYAPHGTMRTQYPKGSRLPLEMIVSYVKQAADALHYIHSQKLVHRDVKPENILLGANDDLLLSDFGIAAAAYTTGSLIIQNQAGTPAYMAPEQILNMPRPESDQYALGVVVYEWLCGHRPFDGLEGGCLHHHLHTSLPPPRTHLPTIFPAIENVVLKALVKNPKERFVSVQAFATALEQAHQEEKRSHSFSLAQPTFSSALPASQPSTVIPSLSQSPQSPVEISSVAVLESLQQAKEPVPAGSPIQIKESTSLSSKQREKAMVPTPADRQLQQNPERISRFISRRKMLLGLGLAGLTFVGGGLAWLTAPRSGGSRTAVTYPPKSSPTLTPTVTPPPQGTVLSSYSGHSDSSVTAVAWSPDGRFIASTGLDTTVQISNAATGEHIYTYLGHYQPPGTPYTRYVNAVAWSPNGRRIASGGDDKTVQVWDAPTGGHVYTYRGHSGFVKTVAWSPDSKWVASGSGTDRFTGDAQSPDHSVQVWNAATGKIHFSYRGHSGGVNAIAWSPNGMWIASASDDKTVQVWDATTGGPVYTFRRHFSAVFTLAWSPDSARIISSDSDSNGRGGTIQVWNALDGGNSHVYGELPQYASRLGWSPNGQRLVACDGGLAVQVWDATDDGYIYVFQRDYPGSVFAVAWSPEGKRIAQVGNGPVLVWAAG